MYITNFQHFLDEQGNIPVTMPKEARELANFFALLVDDASLEDYDAAPTIRCIEKNCEGLIIPIMVFDTDEIHWSCTRCEAKGIITGWQGTKWDNR
ncbi:hypothetical protein [Mangrovibacterium lignilyticum]|uniref:hypothetical protein n=1 Tax=Mangrovibacterium lignilyticum TaxID=2668052 RepID=UPI0013D111C3|nr:hypothetical protein [Mangrovibacterium lignilyticum]